MKTILTNLSNALLFALLIPLVAIYWIVIVMVGLLVYRTIPFAGE